MAKTDQPASLTIRPDIHLLTRLLVFQKLSLLVITLIAGTVLLAWLFPHLGGLLPGGWSLMKANTALCALLAATGLALTQFRGGPRWRLRTQLCALLLIVVAGSALWAHMGMPVTGIEVMLAQDLNSIAPGRMSIQSAAYFTLLGLTLLLIRPQSKGLVYLVDVLAVVLVAATLLILAGYCFGATRFFGESTVVQVSPLTLLCIVLLTFVRVGHRAEYSIFSVVVGLGIGSRIARLLLPFAFLVPYALVLTRTYVTDSGLLPPAYAAALTASVTALVLFLMVLWLAWRINNLERDLRDMSLTDELTRIYNHRGFYFLGEQALREANRTKSPMTTLFFDLDGLKQVNDLHGHEVGSRLLLDFSRLMRRNFRGADILGRVGGDEFAVVIYGSNPNAPQIALQRLSAAVADANKREDMPYLISYSVGSAVSDPRSKETFVKLMSRADIDMYVNKSSKKAAR